MRYPSDLTDREWAVLAPLLPSAGGPGRPRTHETLRIRAPDGLVTRAGSTAYRAFLTSGPAGEWAVTAEPQPGLALASGQPNPARVTVAARETTRLALVVTATARAP